MLIEPFKQNVQLDTFCQFSSVQFEKQNSSMRFKCTKTKEIKFSIFHRPGYNSVNKRFKVKTGTVNYAPTKP